MGEAEPQPLVRRRVERVEGSGEGLLGEALAAITNRQVRMAVLLAHGQVHRGSAPEARSVVKDQVQGIHERRAVHGRVYARARQEEAHRDFVVSRKLARDGLSQLDQILTFVVLLDLLDEEVEILERAEGALDPLAELGGLGVFVGAGQRLPHRPAQVRADPADRLPHSGLAFDLARGPALGERRMQLRFGAAGLEVVRNPAPSDGIDHGTKRVFVLGPALRAAQLTTLFETGLPPLFEPGAATFLDPLGAALLPARLPPLAEARGLTFGMALLGTETSTLLEPHLRALLESCCLPLPEALRAAYLQSGTAAGTSTDAEADRCTDDEGDDACKQRVHDGRSGSRAEKRGPNLRIPPPEEQRHRTLQAVARVAGGQVSSPAVDRDRELRRLLKASSDCDNPSPDALVALLRDVQHIAVVGLSRYLEKAARRVPSYLAAKGYDVIPVNPNASRLLGRRSYPTLEEVEEPVDMVLVFRPSEKAGSVVEAALERPEQPAIWLQTGVVADDAARAARLAGRTVVQDLCIFRVHRVLVA